MTHAADRVAEQHARTSLAEGLRWAVPLCMLELRGLTPERRRRRIPHGTVANLGMGDAIMFHSKSGNWKNTAVAFQAYAWALALQALEPGGATFPGVHWCATKHEGCPHGDRPDAGPPKDWREPLDELEALANAEGLAA